MNALSRLNRLGRLGRPVTRRVALRDQALEHFDAKITEFADGAAENVAMLDLAERDLHDLEEEVFALVEAALERDPLEGLQPAPGQASGADAEDD